MADDSILQKSGESDRLESWKEIAGYLGRDVRTVQRWERSEGLPVHRHQHGERGSVFAYRAEIDAWRAARQTPPPEVPSGDAAADWKRLVSYSVALLGLAVLAVAWRGARSLTPMPVATVAEAPHDAPRLLDALTREGASVRTIRVDSLNPVLALVKQDKELYVADFESRISVVDTETLRVVHTYDVSHVTALTRSGDERHVYAGTITGDVAVIDTDTRRLARVATGARIRSLALNSDDRTLYVAGLYSGLLALDTATRAVRRLSALPCPIAVAHATAVPRLYVNYQCSGPGGRPGHDAVDVVDTATNTSLGAIVGLPNVGGEIAVSPDGSQIWADGADACTARYDRVGCPTTGRGIVNVLRASDRSLIRSLAVGTQSYTGGTKVAFTPDGSRVAVKNELEFHVFNAATLAPIESARRASFGSVAFTRDGRVMYVAAETENGINIVPIAQRAAPPRGLTGRWSGDGTANDIHTLVHGELDGAVGFAPGYIGQAFRFDSAGGSIRIEYPGNLGIYRQPFTMALWINAAGGTAVPAVLADKADSQLGAGGWRIELTADRRLAACFASGEVPCDDGQGRLAIAKTQIQAGRWRHVTVAWDGQTARLYLDGRLDGEATLPGFVDTDTAPLRFGSGPSGRRPFAGRLDEIEFYHRALTAAEIASRASVRP